MKYRVFDVCIIGAGLAGTYLAAKLRRLGATVVLLERGVGMHPTFPPLDFAKFEVEPYRGATHGRAFCLGGTSALWGGQLIPMSRTDCGDEAIVAALDGPLRPNYLNVWKGFGLSEGLYESLFEARSEFVDSVLELRLRRSFALPVRRRNAWSLWGELIQGESGVEIVEGAWPVRFQSDRNAHRALSLEINAKGEPREIRASRFVLAAGALESTLLSACALRSIGRSLLPSPLRDHLSFNVGTLEIKDHDGFNALFSPQLDEQGLSFKRYEMTEAIRKEEGFASAFVHAGYDPTQGLPSWLHSLAQSIQSKDWYRLIKSLPRASFMMPGIASMIIGVGVRRRLEWPKGTTFSLKVDFEQCEDSENVIRPLSDACDAKGAISWRVTEEDKTMATNLCSWLRERWHASEHFGKAARLVSSVAQTYSNPLDVYHPFGSLMSAVIHGEGADFARLEPMRNVHVASTATLSRIGVVNPSFTLLAMGDRLAEELAKSSS